MIAVALHARTAEGFRQVFCEMGRKSLGFGVVTRPIELDKGLQRQMRAKKDHPKVVF